MSCYKEILMPMDINYKNMSMPIYTNVLLQRDLMSMDINKKQKTCRCLNIMQMSSYKS